MGYLGTRELMPKIAVWTLIVVNAIWTIDSIALLFTSWVQPNMLGIAFVVMQAVTVAVFAELQYIGLRKSDETVTA